MSSPTRKPLMGSEADDGFSILTPSKNNNTNNENGLYSPTVTTSSTTNNNNQNQHQSSPGKKQRSLGKEANEGTSLTPMNSTMENGDFQPLIGDSTKFELSQSFYASLASFLK